MEKIIKQFKIEMEKSLKGIGATDITFNDGELTKKLNERRNDMKRFNLENVSEFKFKSEITGGVRYLIVDHEQGIISTDYYLHNGGHRPCEMVQLKELKRLENYYINILGYKKVD